MSKVTLFDIKRQETNLEILMTIAKFVERYPHLRFIQILTILEISDNFSEEPQITLEKLKQTINKLDGWK